MSTITFDTYKFIKELETSGMPTVQAEALLKVQQEILDHSIDNTLATKADLDKMERRIDIKLTEHDGEFRLIRWMLGVLIGTVLMVALKLYFPV